MRWFVVVINAISRVLYPPRSQARWTRASLRMEGLRGGDADSHGHIVRYGLVPGVESCPPGIGRIKIGQGQRIASRGILWPRIRRRQGTMGTVLTAEQAVAAACGRVEYSLARPAATNTREAAWRFQREVKT